MSKWEGAERHLDVTEFVALCEAIGTSAVAVLAEVEAVRAALPTSTLR
jgi:energy-converting hydrogenase Eha subunit C